jgi:hypothetical protein
MPLVNPPKKHHFVPKCYLECFIQENNLFAINIQLARDGHRPQPRKVTSGQICYKYYYYLLQPEPANPMYALHELSQYQIETDVLRIWEHKFPELYERLIGKPTVSQNDAVAMAEFIIQMKIRNPAWERFNEKNSDRMYEEAEANLLKELASHPLYSNLPPEILQALMKELKQQFLADGDRAKKLQLSSLVHRARPGIGQNEIIKKGLVDACWKLIDLSHQDAYFVTTDNPGVAIDINNIIHNSKFSDGAFFFFPLSSKHCLVISDIERDNAYSLNLPEKEIGQFVYTDEQVAGLNELLCQVCDTTVVSASEIALIKIVNAICSK